MADDRLDVKITANTGEFDAGTKSVKASFDGMRVSAEQFAEALRRAGGDTSAAALGKAFAGMDRDAQATAKAVGGVGSSAETMAQKVGASTQAVSNGLRLNRMGMLELQAAGVNTFQALASGMSPFHVAIMEGAQVIGALVQGGLVTMKGAIAALTSPIGAVTIGATAMAGAFGLVAFRAIEAERALGSLHNRMLLQGRDARQVTASARVMAEQMTMEGGLPFPDARTGAIAIQEIPNISAKARESLGESFEALTRAQFGGDAEKAADALNKAFGSTSRMKAFAEENDLVTGALKRQFDAAIGEKDSYKASEIAAGALRDRLSGVTRIIKQARDELPALAKTWIATHDLFTGNPIVPEGVAHNISRLTGTGVFGGVTFPEGSPGPSPDQRRADRILEERTKRERELNQAISERDFLQKQIDTPGFFDASQLEAAKHAIDELKARITELQRPKGDATFMRQLEADLAQQNAAIVERMSGAGQALGQGAAQGLDANFNSALDRAIAKANAAGIAVSKGSGFRTHKEQQHLFDASDRSGRMVARPGNSMHERGAAMDLRGAGGRLTAAEREKIRPYFEGEGLTWPMSYEPWHVEPAGARATARAASPAQPRSADAARIAELQNTLAFYTAVKADETKLEKLSNAEKEELDSKLAAVRKQLAEQTLRTQDQAAREGASVAMDSARRQTDFAERGTEERIALAQHEVAVAKQLFNAGSREVIAAEYRLKEAQRDAAQAGIRDKIAQAGTEVQESRQRLQTVRSDLATEVADRHMTAVQAAGYYIEQVEREIDARRKALAELKTIDGLTLEQKRTLEKQMVTAVAEGEKERADARRQYAKAQEAENDKYAADIKRSFDGIGSSVTEAFNGLVTGQTTYADAMKKLWQGVTNDVLTGIEGIASKAAAVPLAGLLGQPRPKSGEGVGDVLGNAAGNWVGKQIGNLIPDIAGSAAGGAAGAVEMTAAMTAGGAAAGATLTAAMTAGGAAAAAEIAAAMAAGGAASAGASAVGTAVGVAGKVASVAAAPATGGFSLFGLAFARGGVVPAAAGGWALPSSFGTDKVMAALTPGEMVLPTDLSSGMQRMIRGGGQAPDSTAMHMHFHGPADGPSIERWFKANMMRNSDVVGRMFRQNRLTPRTI
jgi:LAS superfamily LD-carboxypeptidase LdcB